MLFKEILQGTLLFTVQSLNKHCVLGGIVSKKKLSIALEAEFFAWPFPIHKEKLNIFSPDNHMKGQHIENTNDKNSYKINFSREVFYISARINYRISNNNHDNF